MRNWISSRLGIASGITLHFLTVSTAAAAAAAVPSPSATNCADPAKACIAPAAESLTSTVKIDPDGLLLFSVTLDKLTLTEGLAAYGSPDDPFIPIGELTRLFEYDVDVMPAERRIVGRLGEARTSLIVDLATGTSRVGAKTVPLTSDDVAVTPTEIYLRASAISRLLPVTLKVDSSNLDIAVVPQALLPVQSRLTRLARDRNFGTTEPRFQDEVMRPVAPYRLFSLPSLDVSVSVGASSGQETQGPRFPFRYDIRSGSDLGFMGLNAYVGSDETGAPSVARFLLERRSVDGKLFGPLHARVLSIGDVYTPGFAVGPRSASGRGFSISTVPLDQTNIFNRIDLRGELPIGYDVELYVNDILQGGQNTPNKGRYEFLNVPLSRGINVVRIVTYGPHGERNEQTRVVNVGGGQLSRGEMTLELGAVQQDRPILDLSSDKPSAGASSRGAGGLRAAGSVNYGLTDLITLSAGASLVPVTRDTGRQLYTLGARTSIFGFLTQLDYGYEANGGSGEAVGVAGQLFGVSTFLRYLQFHNGFIDENGPGGGESTRLLANRSEASFDGNARLFGLVIPLSLRGTRTVYTDRAVDLTASARASATVAAALVSTGFEYANSLSADRRTDQRLTGFLAASTYRNFKWQVRSTLDYDILPELQPRALAITVDRDLGDKARLRLGLGENLQAFEQFNVTAAATVRTQLGDVSLTADYLNTDRSWRVGAQLNFGLAFDQERYRYQLTRNGPGTGGSVAFHAFYDKNGNGRWDPGEPGVPNVVVEGGERPATTDEDGRVLITGIGASPSVRLNVSLDRMDNPSVKAPPHIIQFTPRPGQVLNIEYPMESTSEILIRILMRRPDGSKVGVSGVLLRLVGANGRISEAKTEFDGSASFTELTGGTYELQLDDEQAKRLRMRLVAPLTVKIKGDGGFTPDAFAEVRFEPRPQEQAQAQTNE